MQNSMLVQSCISFRWPLLWLASLSEMDGLDSWVVPFDADCRIDLWLVDNAIGVVSASAVVAVLLMCTRACGDTSLPVLLVVPLATIICCLTPVRDAWGVIWLFFSVLGAELHGLPRSLSMGLFDGQRASKTLSNRVTGRLTSARRELTSTERGDLDSCLVLRSFSVAVVVVTALLVGFSLAIVARIMMSMVGNNQGEGST